MQRSVRWVAAVLVTAAAFAVPTWLCGAVVLPPALKDPAIRWGVAAALGAALAALAAAWGHSFASRTGGESSQPVPAGGPVQATGERAVAIHGNSTGGISTGDTGASRTPADLPARQEPAPPAAVPAPPSAPGSVTASGERSIAISGNPGGNISTGDHPGGGQA
ncbi:hypothetical protein [Streptomyces sp. NBC_01727]|uniref:hypothetical protein n=1 Tax=Streptomyces sp. NBC_01727 TaxID=2975924 RepID=UPI002E109EF3|nr:hypothetical protein OIE76_06710 [Streptomyces sp. NBC_01727]